MIRLAICSAEPDSLYGAYEAAVLFSLETETELEIYKFHDPEAYAEAARGTVFDAVITDDSGLLGENENACSFEKCQELFKSFKKRS